MKKLFFMLALFAIASFQHSFAQDNAKTQPSQLLHLYFDIKNALVAGNANTASMKAGEFVKIFNGLDSKIVNDATRKALIKDAGHISETKEIKHQREHFAAFSINMYALAKTVKLTTDPIYYAYCPMKKAYWLSAEATINNPYFGGSMLTCGKVEETLK